MISHLKEDLITNKYDQATEIIGCNATRCLQSALKGPKKSQQRARIWQKEGEAIARNARGERRARAHSTNTCGGDGVLADGPYLGHLPVV